MSKFRKTIIAGNWKMNKSVDESKALVDGIKRDLAECRDVDVVVCPPFTSLSVVGEAIADTSIKLGAQNMHWQDVGAQTGEICASMLRSLYCHYVILGHSERRRDFGETDDVVNKKVKTALAGNLIPIMCVGETLAERKAGQEKDVVKRQMCEGLAGVESEDIARAIIAYEPVWAIGTGETATPEQAQEMHAFIRGILAEIANEDVAQTVRIQYGGSMKPSNATDLLAKPDIDGGLIGGAALEARSFVELVTCAREQ